MQAEVHACADDEVAGLCQRSHKRQGEFEFAAHAGALSEREERQLHTQQQLCGDRCEDVGAVTVGAGPRGLQRRAGGVYPAALQSRHCADHG